MDSHVDHPAYFGGGGRDRTYYAPKSDGFTIRCHTITAAPPLF